MFIQNDKQIVEIKHRLIRYYLLVYLNRTSKIINGPCSGYIINPDLNLFQLEPRRENYLVNFVQMFAVLKKLQKEN